MARFAILYGMAYMGFVSFSLLGDRDFFLSRTLAFGRHASMQVWTLKQLKPPAGEDDHHHH